MAGISFKVTGGLAPENKISMHLLGGLCTNTQSALNRAFLEAKNSHVYKYQKLSKDDYEKTIFMFQSTREGSFIVDFIEHSAFSLKIAKTFQKLLDPAYEIINKGFKRDYYSSFDQVQEIMHNIELKAIKPKTFEEFKQNPPKEFAQSYAAKSLTRDISTALTPLKRSTHADDSITLSVISDKTHDYFFNKELADSLYHLANDLYYLNPVIYNMKLFEMNEKTKTAIAYNLDNNNSEQKIRFVDKDSFNSARNKFNGEELISIIGMPCAEYATLDVNRGDILYVDRVGN